MISGNKGWRVFVEEGLSAHEQMARDATLAREALPMVRFFVWDPPAVSLGFKQVPPAWLASAAGFEQVERPTGGGLAFHGSDVSVAVIVPRRVSLPLALLMQAVCENAVALCRDMGANAHAVADVPAQGRIAYCLTDPSSYAVMIDGKKAAGFALRRFPKTWLIQGSLLVRPLPQALAGAIPAPVSAQLHAGAMPLAQVLPGAVAPCDVARRWADGWSGWWEEATAPNPQPTPQNHMVFIAADAM
ncbi:MAG: hypothetical protein HY598_01145 [Candidatus Omnitrophica bacterium]|nr:hypothetical protein [Candidatus Omnitrophota bacterium]